MTNRKSQTRFRLVPKSTTLDEPYIARIWSHWATSSLLIICHSNFHCGLRKTHGPSRSSNVVDFGTNRKRVCDFLLVINNNLGPILPCVRDIAGFLRGATPPLFHPNFKGVPLGLDCRCCGSEKRRPKLIVRVFIFELTQHTSTVHQRHGQTDGQTDERQTDQRLTIALVGAYARGPAGPRAYAGPIYL